MFAKLSLALLVAVGATSARAQIPVTDILANVSLTQQLASWAQQYGQMAQQYQQMVQQYQVLQQQYGAITGGRGMQGIAGLSYQQRNYIPDNYASLTNDNSADYQAIARANEVLSSSALNAMTPQQRQIIESGRRAAAIGQTSARTAYQSTSQGFSRLQGLIDAIGGATDAKAIADLQGRVSGEQAMLANEQNKLLALQQVQAADRAAAEQMRLETAIRQRGRMDSLSTVNY